MRSIASVVPTSRPVEQTGDSGRRTVDPLPPELRVRTDATGRPPRFGVALIEPQPGADAGLVWTQLSESQIPWKLDGIDSCTELMVVFLQQALREIDMWAATELDPDIDEAAAVRACERAESGIRDLLNYVAAATALRDVRRAS